MLLLLLWVLLGWELAALLPRLVFVGPLVAAVRLWVLVVVAMRSLLSLLVLSPPPLSLLLLRLLDLLALQCRRHSCRHGCLGCCRCC